MTTNVLTDTSTAVSAPALDGSNPLGFLAALGVLSVLDTARRAGGQPPRVSWCLDGHWRPVFWEAESLESVVAAVMTDKAGWSDDPALRLAYDAQGRLVDPRHAASCVRDLKPPPESMRAYLDMVVEEAMGADVAERPTQRRSLALVAAYGSDVVQDNNGRTKPTALHFTAGRQLFLDAVVKLQSGVTQDHIREALLGPWTGSSMLPSMSWDATVSRNYALRAGDPSKEKRGSNPGADWLAFVGLSFTRSVPTGRRLSTTGVVGGWKDAVFTWPLWAAPLPARVVGVMVSLPALAAMPTSERRARGVDAVYSSGITRSDQGGYGGFSPSASL